MSYRQAFEKNHSDFEIVEISYEDDARERRDPISFRYTAPDISVDTSGRFAKHEIVGGSTVRQKIGEDPIEVTVDGVCREEIARALDGLRDAKFGRIVSERLPGGTLDVQFASTSTSPLEDGGAVAISDNSGEFLYEFTLSCIELTLDASEGTDIPDIPQGL